MTEVTYSGFPPAPQAMWDKIASLEAQVATLTRERDDHAATIRRMALRGLRDNSNEMHQWEVIQELARQLDDARTKALGVFVSTEGDESRLSHALNDTCEFCGGDLLDGTEGGGVCWSCFQNHPKPTDRPFAYDMPVGSVVTGHDYDGEFRSWTRVGSDDWRKTGNEGQRIRSGWIEGLFSDDLVTEWRLPDTEAYVAQLEERAAGVRLSDS